jgi:hypothetical protein
VLWWVETANDPSLLVIAHAVAAVAFLGVTNSDTGHAASA